MLTIALFKSNFASSAHVIEFHPSYSAVGIRRSVDVDDKDVDDGDVDSYIFDSLVK
jgi:hypothetical protein